MCKNKTKYGDHFETLVALISHMALMDDTSRTPSNLAKYLSLDKDETVNVLQDFKGIFRKSIKTFTETGEHFYCLQIRYATRKHEGDNDEGDFIQLKADYLSTLLDFVAKMVETENASTRQASYNVATIIASIIALVASITAAIIAISSKVQ